MIPDLSTIYLHQENLNIETITQASNTLEFTYQPGGIEITLNDIYQPDDSVEIEIQYTAPIIPNYSQVGMHKWGDYMFTFAEPYGARKWFPCYDLPFDKATIYMELIVPLGYTAVGNGELYMHYLSGINEVFYWKEDHPISTYLVSIAAGPYLEMTDSTSTGIPLHYYVYPVDSADAVEDFENTGDMTDFFSETFGGYPFDSYGMAMAHIFNGWGAMEHQSTTTYGDQLVTGNKTYEYIVAHELAHMWWGDALSPLTFAEIWLNEGFASYSEALYIEARYDTLDEHMENKADSYFWEDENQLRYPIYNPPSNYLFGSAVYNKGCWVVHMLRYVLGDDAFFSALQNYYETYKYGNVITDEFQAEMEDGYGNDLDWFFDTWVYEAGYPEYFYSWTAINPNDYWIITIDLLQSQQNAPMFTMPVEFYLGNSIADTVVTFWNDQANQTFIVELEFYPTEVIFDPGNNILKKSYETGLVESPELRPVEFALHPVYPNPFNSTALVRFSIEHAGRYSLRLYNTAGQTVIDYKSEFLSPGNHRQQIDAGDLASGVYILNLIGQRQFSAQKVIVLK